MTAFFLYVFLELLSIAYLLLLAYIISQSYPMAY